MKVKVYHNGDDVLVAWKPTGFIPKCRGFRRELKKLPGTFAMVHSKVVLVDPFTDHPILLTGSHNLGPKASGANDENLLIIRNAPGLAGAYATTIMAVYNQYRWRFRRHAQPKSKRWKGLEDGDTWQEGYLKTDGSALRETISGWASDCPDVARGPALCGFAVFVDPWLVIERPLPGNDVERARSLP